MPDWTQPAMFDDPHARRSDPTSSHVVVDTIAKWTSLNNAILACAERCGEVPFDDTDMTVMVAERYGRPVQRNVVARARGLLEQEGLIERLGLRQREDRRTLHFRARLAGEGVIPRMPAPKMIRFEATGITYGGTVDHGLVLHFDRPTDRDVAWRSIQEQMGWND